MIALALTGSIASGKSTTAKMFAFYGAKIFDADRAVHTLYREDATLITAIEQHFPGTTGQGGVIRHKLAAIVHHDRKRLTELEALVHPAVRKAEQHFLRRSQQLGVRLTISDIPLLFERQEQADYHAALLVSAPPQLQKQRFLGRPGMTEEIFQAIMSRQMPLREKRKFADFEIPTGLGRAYTIAVVKEILLEAGIL